MTLREKGVRHAVTIFAFVALAACGHSPPPQFFTLDPVQSQGSHTASIGKPVRIDVVHIPPELDRLSMVRETGTNQLKIDDQKRWGRPTVRSDAPGLGSGPERPAAARPVGWARCGLPAGNADARGGYPAFPGRPIGRCQAGRKLEPARRRFRKTHHQTPDPSEGIDERWDRRLTGDGHEPSDRLAG